MSAEPGREIVAAKCRELGWSPRCLSPPSVAPALTELHPVGRSAEVLRYSLAKFEYWISPGGYVREVLRLSSLLAALLGIPVLMIMPLVTLLFTQVLCWLNLIVTILIDLACIAAALVLGSAMLKIATRSHSHGRPNNRRQR